MLLRFTLAIWYSNELGAQAFFYSLFRILDTEWIEWIRWNKE